MSQTNNVNTKVRPILFRADMVRAILAGSKDQTRRPIDLSRVEHDVDEIQWCIRSQSHFPEFTTKGWYCGDYRRTTRITCPFGKSGDRLWVREAHRVFIRDDAFRPEIWYAADGIEGQCGPWTPSRNMRRSQCRLVLKVTEVRAQRVQDMSVADVIADIPWISSIDEFRSLWDGIYGSRYPFDSNPWAWAIGIWPLAQSLAQ
jgi:hypothetical protein